MFNLLPYHKWSFKKVILILWLFYFFLSSIIQILVLLYLYSLLLFFRFSLKYLSFPKKKKNLDNICNFTTRICYMFKLIIQHLQYVFKALVTFSNYCDVLWFKIFLFLWILSNFWQNVNFPNIIILHLFIQLILIYFFCLITCCLLIYLSFQRKSSA